MSRAFPDARAFLVAATAMTLPALLSPGSSLATSSSSLPPPGSSPLAVGQPERREIFVLFPSGEDDLLHAQKRTIFWTSTVEDRAKQALAELISGPTEGLLPIIPADARVREFYLLPDGTGFVDFSRELLKMPGGSATEHLISGAIVDTLAVNFPQVRKLGILVEGEEIETLNGHLDTRLPVRPDPSILEPALAEMLKAGAGAGTEETEGTAAPAQEPSPQGR